MPLYGISNFNNVTLLGSTSGTIQLTPTAIAGTNTITFPATTGTLITTGDTGTVTNTMLTGTFTNKRIDPRVSIAVSSATLTPDISAYDQYCLTAQAVGLTVNAPIGTPVNGDKLILRIIDNGSAQTISWNGTYTVIGVTLPTTTTAGKMTYIGCIYNADNTRWDVVAVTTQA
mgnify:CR=1 FL=1